jgi:hypothetical protein
MQEIARNDIDASFGLYATHQSAKQREGNSSVCKTKRGHAAFEREGIIPSRRHAKDLPATVLSLLRLATAKTNIFDML